MPKDVCGRRPDDLQHLNEAMVTDLDDGFVCLVRAHEGVVFAVALRVCGNGEEAEDLCAEAFLRAYRALRTYDACRIRALSPRSWLLTILLNTWRNSVRTASRRPRPAPIAAALELPASSPGVEEQVERAETRRELALMVGTLPERQRLAVVLRHVVDLPIREVATVMGIPEGTAKSHVSRGLSRLRELCRDESTTTARSDLVSARARELR